MENFLMQPQPAGLTLPEGARHKRRVKTPLNVLLVILFSAVLFPADASAKTRALWNGLVSFEMPAKSKIGKEDDDSYLLQPRQSSRKVAVLIVREDLGPRLTGLSDKKLADALKKRFTDENQKVENFRVKRNVFTGRISGKADVPWSKRKVRAKGEFRIVRVAPSLVVGAIAVSEPGDFGKTSIRPFRKVVTSFKVGKSK